MEGAVWQDNSSGWKEHFIFLPRSPADSLTLHKCLMNVYWMNRQISGGRVWPQDIGALLRAASSGPCAPGPGLSMLWSITEFMPRVCITGSSGGEVVRTDWSCQKGKQPVSVVSSERWLFNFIWSATGSQKSWCTGLILRDSDLSGLGWGPQSSLQPWLRTAAQH